MEHNLSFTYYKAPFGWMKIAASDIGIAELLFAAKPAAQKGESVFFEECIKELNEYFNNKRTTFSVPLALQGTDFQKKVWNELLKIPFGKTISYMQLAINLGDKKSIRAAGTANGRNPVAIIVPCHRVIGSSGDLVGYGGGLDKKKWLLGHEGVLTQQELFSSK